MIFFCVVGPAIKYQVKTGGFKPSACLYETEALNPFIVRDFSRCIQCGRCVQACNEIVVNRAITWENRTGAPVYAPDREKQVLEKIAKENDGPLPDKCIQAIWRELMSGSFVLERPLRIGYLGWIGVDLCHRFSSDFRKFLFALFVKPVGWRFTRGYAIGFVI